MSAILQAFVPKNFITLVKESFSGWKKDNAAVWCAALSYYTVFSLAPLLVLVVSILGLLFGEEAIEGELFGQIRGLLGDSGAALLQTMIANTTQHSTNIVMTGIGLVTLLLGASGVFGQLKQALNHVWGVQPKPSVGIIGLMRDRF